MSGGSVVLASEWPPGVHNFDYPELLPTVTKISGMIWLVVAVLIVFFLLAYRKPALVPGRAQWLAESMYGFVREGVAKEVIGAEGVRFAPYLATLFCFIALTNVMATVPLFQISPNAHIAYPAVLGVLSWIIFNYVGIRKHGMVKYLKANLFPPVPWGLYPLLVPIEFVSTFLIRPVTLAVRLFANMFAGHLILLVFTLGGLLLLQSDNFFYQGVSVLSFLMAIVMALFEFGVQLLQAYVFTVLTASYISGALAEEH